MSPALRSLGVAQGLSVLALCMVLFKPRSAISHRLRLPVALLAFVLSTAHLFFLIV